MLRRQRGARAAHVAVTGPVLCFLVVCIVALARVDARDSGAGSDAVGAMANTTLLGGSEEEIQTRLARRNLALRRLTKWFKEEGGYLSDNVMVMIDDHYGIGMRAVGKITNPEERFLAVPPTIALRGLVLRPTLHMMPEYQLVWAEIQKSAANHPDSEGKPGKPSLAEVRATYVTRWHAMHGDKTEEELCEEAVRDVNIEYDCNPHHADYAASDEDKNNDEVLTYPDRRVLGPVAVLHWVRLMWHMLIGEKSHWHTYMQTLPTEEDFAGHAMYWGDPEMKELERSRPAHRNTWELTFYHSINIMDLLDPICEAWGDVASPTMKRVLCDKQLRRYTAALSATRVWEDGDKWGLCIPLADMVNHRATANSRVETSSPDGYDRHYYFQVDCVHDVGDELFIAYGRRSYMDTLMHYGFVPADAFVEIEPVFTQNIPPPFEPKPEFEARIEALGCRNFTDDMWGLYSDSMVAPVVVQCYRLRVATEAEMELAILQDVFTPLPLSVRNERAAIERLIAGIAERVAEVQTSKEEDEQVRDEGATLGIRSIGAVRCSERSTLEKGLRHFYDQLEAIKALEKKVAGDLSKDPFVRATKARAKKRAAEEAKAAESSNSGTSDERGEGGDPKEADEARVSME